MADEGITLDEMDANIDEDLNDFAGFGDVDVTDAPKSESSNKIDFEAKGEASDSEIESKPIEKLAKSDPKEPVKEVTEPLKEVVKEDITPLEDKNLSVKVGDNNVDIPESTVFKSKVDGKEVGVSIKELLSNYSGKVSWDKKFGELGGEKGQFNQDKRAFSEEQSDLSNKVNSFVDAVNNKDAVRSIESLAVLANANPVDLRKNFMDLMMGQAKNYMNLSDDDRLKVDNQTEMEYHQKRGEYAEQQLADKNEHMQLTNDILKMQLQHGISDTQLFSLQEQLEQTSETLTLEALVGLHNSNSVQDKASVLLSQVDNSLKNEDGYIKSVAEFIKANPDLSDESIISSIKDAVNIANPEEKVVDKGKKASDAIKSKVKKGSKAAATPQDSTNDYLDDVSDFDEIY